RGTRVRRHTGPRARPSCDRRNHTRSPRLDDVGWRSRGGTRHDRGVLMDSATSRPRGAGEFGNAGLLGVVSHTARGAGIGRRCYAGRGIGGAGFRAKRTVPAIATAPGFLATLKYNRSIGCSSTCSMQGDGIVSLSSCSRVNACAPAYLSSMSFPILGLHHVTAIVDDAQAEIEEA